MPRTGRIIYDGLIYHVLNRGNDRKLIFADSDDYSRFIELMREAAHRHPVNLFAYCLMPNHFHMVLQAPIAADLAHFMHWLATSHVRRYQTKFDSTGHVWQGRYKDFPVQSDHHLITLVRYVEGNPVRAGLVHSCMEWPWSSVNERLSPMVETPMLTPIPTELPANWAQFVDTPLFAKEIEGLRLGVNKQIPFGDAVWQHDVANWKELDLPARGRPRLQPTNK